MILSFSITCKLAAQHQVSDPLRTGIKTVSRRDWSDRAAKRWLNAWQRGDHIHQAWSTAPFVPGAYCMGKFHLSCQPYPEMLIDMPEADLAREGGFWRDKEHFIADIGKGDRYKVLWVIRWDKFIIDTMPR